MPAWRRVLSPQEISNVAEFVFQTFIRADKDDDGAGKHSNTDSGNKKKPS
jgi:mono/diheme cytochrome c family protein